jgi:hypothetical protein
VYTAVATLKAIAASSTPAAPIAMIVANHAALACRRPVTNARALVRRIRASRSRSTYWLNAPAAADAIVTASASNSTCQPAIAGPGVTARPATAVKPMTSPMRSLNRSKKSRTREPTHSGNPRGIVMFPARAFIDGLERWRRVLLIPVT